ncbi:MAG TPA: NADAR family protein [Cyclobacteriaceae bacterium]|nr:NADAR family protein [Cyclobacteriaceae bacterium]
MDIRQYIESEVITFRSTKAEFGGLSNMASGYSINVNGVIIPSSEHLYQACRYPLFPDLQEEIIRQDSPMTAKMISKKHHKYTRQDWDNVRFKIMRWCLEVKLSQNWEKFSQILLKTGSKPIVELSTKDKVWAAVKEGDKLIGTNALGRLLMELRENYVKKNEYQRCIDPLPIPGFLLFGNPIEEVCNESFDDDFKYAFEEESLLA